MFGLGVPEIIVLAALFFWIHRCIRVRKGWHILGLIGVVSLIATVMGVVYLSRQSPAPAIVATPAPSVTIELPLGSQRPKSGSGDGGTIPSPGDIVPRAINETVYHGSGRLVSEKTLEKLPVWVTQPVEPQADAREQLILHSQRFATLDEARAQLWPQLRGRMVSELAARHPELAGWSPTLDEVRAAGVIRKECNVTWPLTVGGFTENVYQVHWQAELTEAICDQLYASIRPAIVRQRLAILAAGLGGVTVLFAAGAFFFHRREPASVRDTGYSP